MQDYRVEVFRAAPPYTASIPPPSGSDFVDHVDAFYLCDVEGARNVGENFPDCVRFDIYEEDYTLIERWYKQRTGEWHNSIIEVESEGVD